MVGRWLWSAAFFSIAAGCSTTRIDFLRPPEPGIFWPLPPDSPRVRFVGALRGVNDLRPSKSLGRVAAELLEGPGEAARFAEPHAVAVDRSGQRVAVADPEAHCVHLFDLGKRDYRRLDDVGAESDGLEAPVAVTWVEQALWVADAGAGRIVVFHADARVDRIGAGLLQRPAGMTYCPNSRLIVVADAAAHALALFDGEGNFLRLIGSRGSEAGQFNFPTHLACAADGTVIVADSLNFRIQRLTAEGRPLAVIGRKGDAAGDLALPKGVAVDRGGYIWIADAQFENVQAFDADGRLMMVFGREGRGPGEFWLPAGLCIDDQNRMWVADRYNRRVQIFELLGYDEAH